MAVPDPRFSLANERTFLAWIRTALALIAGGVAAATAVDWDSEVARWLVSIPPLVGGAAMAAFSGRHWQQTEDAMHEEREIPIGAGMWLTAGLTAIYGALVLVVVLLD